MAPDPFTGITILVPVDFDASSKRAASLAIDFAQRFRGEVVLLHVVPPMNLPEGTRLLPADALEEVDPDDYVTRRAEQMLDAEFLEFLASGVAVRKEVRTGHVVDAVLRASDECGARLVVIGTHGRKGPERLALGSVAESVVRRSHIPVLVARQAEDELQLPHGDASFTGAAIASGAVAGAAVGALGGPVGVAAGAVVGTLIGGIAGAIASTEDARARAHDRELDDTIGVSRGSLGTPAETKRPSKAALRDAEKNE